jgi:hypothetical protein
MNGPNLQATEFLLEFDNDLYRNGPVVVFASGDRKVPEADRGQHEHTQLFLARDVWLQMGNPQLVTVLVQVGNKLDRGKEE